MLRIVGNDFAERVLDELAEVGIAPDLQQQADDAEFLMNGNVAAKPESPDQQRRGRRFPMRRVQITGVAAGRADAPERTQSADFPGDAVVNGPEHGPDLRAVASGHGSHEQAVANCHWPQRAQLAESPLDGLLNRLQPTLGHPGVRPLEVAGPIQTNDREVHDPKRPAQIDLHFLGSTGGRLPGLCRALQQGPHDRADAFGTGLDRGALFQVVQRGGHRGLADGDLVQATRLRRAQRANPAHRVAPGNHAPH